MATGKGRCGPFPLELQRLLLGVIDLLARQKQLPNRAALVLLLSEAGNWAGVVQRLKLFAGRRHGWAYSAGAFVRRQLQRLFAKCSPAKVACAAPGGHSGGGPNHQDPIDRPSTWLLPEDCPPSRPWG